MWGTMGAAEHPCEQIQASGAWQWHLEAEEKMCNAGIAVTGFRSSIACRTQGWASSRHPTGHYLPLCRISSLPCICFTEKYWNKMVSSPAWYLTNSKDGQKVQCRKYFESPGWKLCSLMSTVNYLSLYPLTESCVEKLFTAQMNLNCWQMHENWCFSNCICHIFSLRNFSC